MSRLKTMTKLLNNDPGMALNRNRILHCMATIVYGKDSSECMVRSVVEPVNCDNCPSDSLTNFNKVMECLDLTDLPKN